MGHSLYDNYKICDCLDIKDICIVVEQYRNGAFSREFHLHVPKFRLSDDSRTHLLKALVIRFSKMNPDSIVSHYLNRRGTKPHSENFNLQIAYPEPGVLRTYCGANTKAWYDQVVDKSQFRKTAT